MLGWSLLAGYERMTKGSYVLDALHNLHLILNFLVQDAILHEAPLVEFFGGVWLAVILGRDFVYRGECAFTNLADAVVLCRAIPFPRKTIGGLLRGVVQLSSDRTWRDRATPSSTGWE